MPFELPFAKFSCHCCGAEFRSRREQDPNRDKGYGTCSGCRSSVYKNADIDTRDPTSGIILKWTPAEGPWRPSLIYA